MRSERNMLNLCSYTNGQIGWRDSDGNYVSDPLDMGTRHSQNLWDVSAGDLICIYNVSGQLVKVISLSPDNCAVRLATGRSVTLWDATNNTGDAVAYAVYFLSVNGESRGGFEWEMDTSAPYFTECSLQNCTLYFRLHDEDTAGEYVTITVFDTSWNVVGFVMRHKFLTCRDRTGEPLYEIQIPAELLGAGSYIKLSCSDGGGNDAPAVMIPITNSLSAPTITSAIARGSIFLGWGDNNCNELGYVVERKNASTNQWQQMAILASNSTSWTDSNLTGSETYTYRVKAYNVHQNSSWSNEMVIKAPPNSPTNLQAGVYLRPRSLGKIVPVGPLGKEAPPPPPDLVRTNQINLAWEPPVNQGMSIAFYRIKYAWFQECPNPPWCDTYPIHYTPQICSLYYSLYPLPYNNQIYFDVYAFDQSGDSSAFLYGYLTTGGYDAHPVPDTTPDDMLEKSIGVPNDFVLLQNYPNPFNPVTTIDYGLPTNSYVKLTIYNILGQRVKTLVDEEQTAGYKTVMWDGRNDRGEEVGSGIYLYRIQAGSYTKTVKMSLLK
jgi:flagellar hook assembly protein FlgD